MDGLDRWRILRLHVEDQIPLTVLARQTEISLRTLQRWHQLYKSGGIAALEPLPRIDAGTRRTPSELLFVLDRHWKRLGRTLDPDDFTDTQAIAAVERITRGNFRLLERLFPQITRVLKINQLETITDDVIEAAASILVIGN